MKLLRAIVLSTAFAMCFSIAAMAVPITYSVSVDTSSFVGTTGSLDFNLDPGPLTTQPVSLRIASFTSDGSLLGLCPCSTGDVFGQLPSTLTMNNGTAFNDYFDDFTFGNTLSFTLSLYGPALSAPDGTSTSGSSFAFSIFSDPFGTIPAFTNDATNGFAITTNINLDGTTTVTDYSSETSITAQPQSASPVPEPSTLSQVTLAACLWIAFRLRPRPI